MFTALLRGRDSSLALANGRKNKQPNDGYLPRPYCRPTRVVLESYYDPTRLLLETYSEKPQKTGLKQRITNPTETFEQ
jgi:hypothetical protein